MISAHDKQEEEAKGGEEEEKIREEKEEEEVYPKLAAHDGQRATSGQ